MGRAKRKRHATAVKTQNQFGENKNGNSAGKECPVPTPKESVVESVVVKEKEKHSIRKSAAEFSTRHWVINSALISFPVLSPFIIDLLRDLWTFESKIFVFFEYVIVLICSILVLLHNLNSSFSIISKFEEQRDSSKILQEIIKKSIDLHDNKFQLRKAQPIMLETFKLLEVKEGHVKMQINMILRSMRDLVVLFLKDCDSSEGKKPYSDVEVSLYYLPYIGTTQKYVYDKDDFFTTNPKGVGDIFDDLIEQNTTIHAALNGRRTIYYNHKETAKAANEYIMSATDLSVKKRGDPIGSILCRRIYIGNCLQGDAICAILSLTTSGRDFDSTGNPESEKRTERMLTDVIANEYESKLMTELYNLYSINKRKELSEAKR